LTETEELATTLASAAAQWPEDAASKPRLLLRLVELGRRSLAEERERDRKRGRQAMVDPAGALTGVYPPGSPERLPSEWRA
jgi:hypothetical protein